jgi:competence protein ComEA
MRTTFFSSLLFALLTSTSVAVTAAPMDKPAAVASMAGGAMSDGAMNSTTIENRMGKVNLNTADAMTLQKELIGIGKNKADAIVAYRESNGQFTSIDELIEVKGIGKAILDKNREKLSLE